MQTIVTDSPEEAARFINKGGIVAFPTETVYGLGAGICHPEAVERLFAAKGRPGDNPLIVHVAKPGDIHDVASNIGSEAEKLVRRFFPGPLTIVLQRKSAVPDAVTAGLETVGVRCPSNPDAQKFLLHCTCPVAAPSANLSGKPSSTSWKAVLEDLDGKIDCILKGNPSDIGLESTIVDCSGEMPVLLREGAVTLEQLQEVVPSIRTTGALLQHETPRSPGLKYPHYAPRARVVTCPAGKTIRTPPEPRAAYIGLSHPVVEGLALVRRCGSLDEYGRSLFDFFRLCDSRNIDIIYCELPPAEGIGRAIRDRLQRAAGQGH
ncbi:MAG: threonylcarbamoyl-AMP synthase [Chlorobi bacterium]|nr:threonylcarbamoyl-AMP synthase [Chlorobiota bacterium]